MANDSLPTPQTCIRAADPSDAAAIAAVHVASWREAYAGLLPQGMLETLSVPERTDRWARILGSANDPRDTFVFVAECGGEVVGFASGGKQRDETLRLQGFNGEITAIYLLKRAQRQGLGSRLMGMVAHSLCDVGHTAASLWVLRDNQPARSFYERLAGRVEGKKEDRREAITLIELVYAWRDLSVLVRRSQLVTFEGDD